MIFREPTPHPFLQLIEGGGGPGYAPRDSAGLARLRHELTSMYEEKFR
jgi:hypothetical protein